jgi:hypothetical protein
MGCRDRQAGLQAHAAGELPPAHVAELESHVRACADCARDLSIYRLLGRELSAMPDPAVPETLHAELITKLETQVFRWRVQRESPLYATLRRSVAVVLASAFGVALSVALWGWMGRIVAFATERFSRDLTTFWRYLQDLWYLARLLGDVVRTLEPTANSLWGLVRRASEPVTAWGPMLVAAYGVALAVGVWLCWRALRQREERGMSHAA